MEVAGAFALQQEVQGAMDQGNLPVSSYRGVPVKEAYIDLM